ncbi:MAG TPA: B12-binding domain-containing radical SAM protein [Candidatus Brocadiia bacterium]|mgnify:CR=1 FL=1|nr:B12-binding domain-containing radical SAM protein [Candidatus Brocadiia bacterium]
MRPRVLLVNPPVYDFAAYDFWMKPLGLLRVAGALRGIAEMRLLDYLDRSNPLARGGQADVWGRGSFASERLAKPAALACVPRRFHRFGLPRSALSQFASRWGPFDFVLVQTVMTYWYLGVKEVVDEARGACPGAKVALGGVYATLCPEHARSLGVDLVVEGKDLAPLWDLIGVEGCMGEPLWWEGYERLRAGVLKLADGCPFRCSYCASRRLAPESRVAPLARSLADLELALRFGAEDLAFYDDALLFEPERALFPFLERAAGRARFHTPNGLHARFMTQEVARRLVEAGFRSFFLSFESRSEDWHRAVGDKAGAEDLAQAVDALRSAGADLGGVTAYLLLGHPNAESQDLEASMRYAHGLGIRVMLSDFSPLPGTPDGEACRRWVDLDEPLTHNKTAFPLISMGVDRVNRLKALCKELNRAL